MHNTHLTGDLKLISDQIGKWARLQPTIVQLWFFRSRARLANAPDIDFDIAYEVDSLPLNDSRQLTAAMRDAWNTELSDATGHEIHLESIAVEHVQAAVADHGVVVYERAVIPTPRRRVS